MAGRKDRLLESARKEIRARYAAAKARYPFRILMPSNDPDNMPNLAQQFGTTVATISRIINMEQS